MARLYNPPSKKKGVGLAKKKGVGLAKKKGVGLEGMKAKKHLIFVRIALSTVTAIVVPFYFNLYKIKKVAYDVYLQSLRFCGAILLELRFSAITGSFVTPLGGKRWVAGVW